MKIAVIADIHANLAALDVVVDDLASWSPDAVVVAGDVVNRGPQPRECLERVLELGARDGWLFVRGNHEDFVLREGGAHSPRPAWQDAVYQHTLWTYRQLGPLVEPVRAWPDQVRIDVPGGDDVRCTHASMRSNRHGLYPHTSEEELAELIAPAPDVIMVGHTHIPFVRGLNGALIVNAGAVGLPFDGDPRAAYARVIPGPSGWEASIVRLAYNRVPTERAYETSGFLDEGGPMVDLILDELRHARPWLSQWHHNYEEKVAAGEMSLTESIQALLRGGASL